MSNGVITPQNGLIPIRRRDPETRAILTGEAAIDFPVGEDLMREVRGRFDFTRTHESNAIRRFAAERGVDLRDVVDEFLDGQDLGRVKVERFLTNTGLRPLFSPIVEDGLRLGLQRVNAVWQSLIARTVPVDQLSYEYYEFDNGTTSAQDQFSLRIVGQGAPIPTAKVTVSGRSYTLYKQGRGIEWTDEAKLAPIDLAALWFQQVGVQLGWDYHNQIVDSLVNGYFTSDGADAPPVLTSSSAGADLIDFDDLLNAVGTMQAVYGHTPNLMLMSLAKSIYIRTLEAGNGSPRFPNGVEAAGLPTIQISDRVPADKIVFVDTAFAMVRYVNKEFGTEFDRSVQTQVEGSYGTSIEVTVPLFKNARLILDGP